MHIINKPLFDPKNTLLVCVDIQEKLMKVMAEATRVIDNANKLLEAARILSIPTCVSEQYPKGLGSSVVNTQPFPVFEKNTFSVFGCEDLVTFMHSTPCQRIVFFGIESHVCIFQSLKHARAFGLETIVIADACSSRDLKNHQVALEAMAKEGVLVIPTETFLFGSLLSCKDEHFKAISALVK